MRWSLDKAWSVHPPPAPLPAAQQRPHLIPSSSPTSSQPTDKYVHYMLNRVDAFVSQGVRVTLVFDGAPLPSKAGTDRCEHVSRGDVAIIPPSRCTYLPSE